MTSVNSIYILPTDVLSHDVKGNTQSVKQPKPVDYMKLNYKEVLKLPYHIQHAIFHERENKKLQHSFPECFEEGEPNSPIPWSLINSKGYIGKYPDEITPEYRIVDYLIDIKVPYYSVSWWNEPGNMSDGPKEFDLPGDDEYWGYYKSHLQSDNAVAEVFENFCPYITKLKGEYVLVVSIHCGVYLYSCCIPASIIDFSK